MKTSQRHIRKHPLNYGMLHLAKSLMVSQFGSKEVWGLNLKAVQIQILHQALKIVLFSFFFFKQVSCPAWGPNSGPWDQESD